MARVVATQANDGVRSGEPVEIPPCFDGESAVEILDRKAAAHQANGWTVQRKIGGFYTWKLYDTPGGARRKDRDYRVI